METLGQILSPDFLLRNSVYTSVLVGFACPLVGVFLVMRRLVFMGVALPQISSTGVAIALSLPLWFGFHLHDHGAHSAHGLAFAGSMTFTLTAILVLAFLERRGRGQPEGRLGTAYVVAASVEYLVAGKKPLRRDWLARPAERRGHHRLQFRSGADGSNAPGRPGRAGTLSQGVAPGLIRSRDGHYPSQEGSFLGCTALFADRPDRLHGSAQCRSADRLRIFADSRPDGAPVRRAIYASSRRWPLWSAAWWRSSVSGSPINAICPSVRRMSSCSVCFTP